MLPEPFFAPQELADEALAVRDIGVALRVESALRQDLPGADALGDAAEQGRFPLPQHLQERGLTGQEAVFRVPVHQGQLGRKRADDLVPRLLHGPEPCQIDMGLADDVHDRRGGAVAALKRRAQRLPGAAEGGGAFRGRQLEVRGVDILQQRLPDLFPAQARFREPPPQTDQGVGVHIELVGVLVPQTDAADPHRALGPGDLWHRHPFRRAGAQGLQPRAVAGVALRQQGESAGSGMKRDIWVFPVHGAYGDPVQIHRLLSAQAAHENELFPRKALRERHFRPEPEIFPVIPPAVAGARRGKGELFCLPGRKTAAG